MLPVFLFLCLLTWHKLFLSYRTRDADCYRETSWKENDSEKVSFPVTVSLCTIKTCHRSGSIITMMNMHYTVRTVWRGKIQVPEAFPVHTSLRAILPANICCSLILKGSWRNPWVYFFSPNLFFYGVFSYFITNTFKK